MATTQRTKNRISEHSSHWHDTQKVSRSTFGINKPVRFFTCPLDCGWWGWLPEDELKEQGIILDG